MRRNSSVVFPTNGFNNWQTHMRSIIYTLLGILFIVFGAYNLYGGYEFKNSVYASFGFGSILIGALLLLFGISLRKRKLGGQQKEDSTMGSSNSYTGDASVKEEDGAVEIYAIIQAMGVVAVADKRVRKEEVDTISSIYEEMLGMKIHDEEVMEILSEFDEDFNIVERLEKNRSYISPTMKKAIIQSCQKVMVSDLEIVRSEENRIMEIGRALGFKDPEIKSLIASTPL